VLIVTRLLSNVGESPGATIPMPYALEVATLRLTPS